MPKIYHLEGKKFGRLFVKERSPRRGGSNGCNVMWRCVCDCGKSITVATGALNRGDNQSCGCLYKETRHLSGIEKYSIKPPGVASFNHILNSYKQSARVRGKVFNLSDDEFRDLTSSPCVYCGVEPHKTFSHKSIRTNGNYFYNGIDRVDNDVGYVKENCQTCCEICNRAKRNMSHEDFMSWIKRLVKFQTKNENNFSSNWPQ